MPLQRRERAGLKRQIVSIGADLLGVVALRWDTLVVVVVVERLKTQSLLVG